MLKESYQFPLQFQTTQEVHYDISDIGELEERISSGFHADVYRFTPHALPACDQNNQWIAKVPRQHVRTLCANIGYKYGCELARSKNILETHAESIGLSFAATRLYGESQLPVMVQPYIEGSHPSNAHYHFDDILSQICETNVKLYAQTKAAIDMQHFMEQVLWHGPRAPVPIDNFILPQGEDTPVLVDIQLTKVYEDDSWPVRRYKEMLMAAEQTFFRECFGLSFI